MNILLQAYACSPEKGGEFAVSWGWLAHLDSMVSDNDRIYVVSDSLTEAHICYLRHVQILKVNYPIKLYKMLRHTRLWYVLWQRFAYYSAIKSGVHFDIVHVYSLSDYRRVGIWYKLTNAYTILGPVGGGQSCPKSLLCYDDKSHYYRDLVNFYCKYSIVYNTKIRRYSKVYACNYETADYLPESIILPDVPLNDKMMKLDIKKTERNVVTILYCGRLINKKGLMLLLDAVKLIPKSLPFEVLVYGEGDQKKDLLDRVKQLELCDKIFFKGHVPYGKMSQVYENADIFVLPSLRESGGSVLIEAMAHALPIVSLKMALSRLLEEHNTGLFVDTELDKEDIIKSFSDNLVTLILDKELRQKLGRNGYEYVNEKFTWDTMVREVYGTLLNQ